MSVPGPVPKGAKHPENADALFLMARCSAAQQHIAEAVAMLELIPTTHPQAGLPALGMSADWLIQLGRFDEAEMKLRTILKLQSRFIVAHRRLAQLLNCQGRRIEALPHMRALASFQVATASELYGMGTFSDPFVHTDDSETVEIPLSELCRAKLQWFEGHLRESQSMVESFLLRSPVSAAESAFAGRVFAVLQDDERFASWLEQLPRDVEREPEFWFALGDWHARHGIHNVAVRCFVESVQLDDTDRFSFLGLARSLEAVGRDELSRSANRRYELLDDANYIVSGYERTPERLQRLAEMLVELRRPNEARAWLRLSPETIESPLPNLVTDPVDALAHWSTCGVEAKDWPLPDFTKPINRTESKHKLSSLNDANIELHDVAQNAQLDFQYLPGLESNVEQLRMFQITGAGVAILDYDRDGWPDLYFGQGGGEDFHGADAKPNQLFRNFNGERFKNTTLPSASGDLGYAQGVSAADIDQDGFIDLIVANIGPNVLFHNNGDGTFTRRLLEETEPDAWTASIACGDLDGDHLPEIVMVNYIRDPLVKEMPCTGRDGESCSPQRFRAAVNEILQQRDDGTWKPWPFPGNGFRATYGLGVLMTNIDGQYGNDLYIANDTEPNSLWLSEPNGSSSHPYSLTESAHLRGCAVGLRGNSEGSMGIASGDFDRDGSLDLHVTNFTNESSALYLQHDHGIFLNQYLGFGLGEVTHSMVGWGTQAVDFDNDGWTDLAVMNGHLYPSLKDGSPYRMRPQLFCGDQSGFQLIEPTSPNYWATPRLGRALAKLDWNRDGHMDLASIHLDAPVALLQNLSGGGKPDRGNWIQLELVGTTSERGATGSRVTITTAEQTWSHWLTAGDGYQCSNEPLLHIGIGNVTSISKLEIHWPSGHVTSYASPDINHRYLCIENDLTSRPLHYTCEASN